jgi:tetratricopeptide (TPR) repeat protein
VDFPICPDPWFSLARLAYMKNDWSRCITCADKGFALGSPDSAIMFNPLERNYTPHTYYNVALSKVGRVREAIASCDAALLIFPEDSNLKFNKDLYEKYLKEHPEPVPSTQSASPSINKVTFATDTLTEEPKLPHNVTALLALQIWKEMLKYDEIAKARDYLNSLPYFVEDDEQIEKAKAQAVS